MLRELHISNLAVIADATIELSPGLNCFTGQTGAGKSLVIGAIELLLSLRPHHGMLRAGAAEARVTGVFSISHADVRREIGALVDMSLEDEPEIILSRRIFTSGRTSASLNGQPVSGQVLRSIGELLADIHGQNDFQFLMRPGNQLLVLDQFAGVHAEAKLFHDLHARRAELRQKLEALHAGEQLRRGQLELAQFQLAEIDALAPVRGELAQLETQHQTLSNAAQIKKQAAGICAELYDDENAAVEKLKRLLAAVGELAGMATACQPIFEQIRDAIISLDDAAFSLRRMAEHIEIDDEALAQCTDRLNQYNRLMHKYVRRGGSTDELFELGEQLRGQIAELESVQAGGAQWQTEIAEIETRMSHLAAGLTAKRQQAAAQLAALVDEQLAELGMKEARFQTILTALPTTPQDLFPSPAGSEMAEFLIAPNPGQPAQPLRLTASGGEISRVMLGLKSILSGMDRLSVLVFDEIDANVGGRMGLVIGEKLRQLAEHHQVLCITHLPQIAAFGQRHMRIGKSVVGGESFTQIQTLSGAAVIDELAEMITGKEITATARQQAAELVQMAGRKVLSISEQPHAGASALEHAAVPPRGSTHLSPAKPAEKPKVASRAKGAARNQGPRSLSK